jgi:hypothetical protein
MSRSRICLGRDALLLSEDEAGVEVQSAVRLAPGRWVELITEHGARPRARQAFVWSWWLVWLGSSGPLYRGTLRWSAYRGNELPAARGSTDQTGRSLAW